MQSHAGNAILFNTLSMITSCQKASELEPASSNPEIGDITKYFAFSKIS